MDFAQRQTVAPRALPLRLARCIWRQGALTPRCPAEPRLEGRLAVVTGGNAGIGLEIARGLAKRGAEVVIAARTAATAADACARLGAEAGRPVRSVPLDLADLRSVAAAAEALRVLASGRQVEVLVANAGVWPTEHALSAQGHELAFAVNTLGHFALVERLLADGLLAERARVVVLTGDIYVRADACTSDFRYAGKAGGSMAYCRSKLGNLWFARELQRRRPGLEVVAAHPGVVASGLGGGQAGGLRDRMLLSPEAGAQTPLWAATQPVERGGYYHNTLGRVTLPPGDPAADDAAAAALWERLEALAREGGRA